MDTTTALLTGVAVVDRTLVIVGTESDDHVFVERLEPMPIAYWSLNETRGNTVADSAGTPQDGTFFAKGRPDLDDAGPPLAKAPFDAETAADFHGTTKEYIAVPHDPELEVDEGTVMLWFNTDNPWGDQTLFSKDHRDSGQDGLLNIGLDDRRVVVRLQGEGESYSIRTDKVIKKHTWYHLAFSFGEEGMALYLDGVLVGENAFTGGMAANREPIVIGGSLKCNTKDSGDLSRLRVREPFDGRIDEVAFYGKALDGNQIKQSMLKGPDSMGTSDEPLIAVHASFLPDPGQVRTFSAADIDNIEILLGGGDDRACVGDSVDLPVRIDGGSGDDYLKAGRGPSVLLGGEGDDKLIGGGGDDVLEGGSGNDLLIGNCGNDLLSGGDGDDKLIGGRGNDELSGDSGNDKLIGGSGHDHLEGGSGDDILIDWSGHYRYFKLFWYKGFHHEKDRHCVSWGNRFVNSFATYHKKPTPYGSYRSYRSSRSSR
ncbi:MAG: LamG domain-containing protein [Gammaproteobacteria bacterium]